MTVGVCKNLPPPCSHPPLQTRCILEPMYEYVLLNSSVQNFLKCSHVFGKRSEYNCKFHFRLNTMYMVSCLDTVSKLYNNFTYKMMKTLCQ